MLEQQDFTHCREERLPPGTRVLIVEDNPLVAFAAGDMVEAIGGIAIAVEHDVEGALAACERGGFHVALLDMDLEGRSSSPVAAALACLRVPFIVTTGNGPHELPGFDDVPLLAKPYFTRELQRALVAQMIAQPLEAGTSSITSSSDSNRG